MKELVKKIIQDFEINTDESLADVNNEMLILLRDENAVFPCIQVEKGNQRKQYKISAGTAKEIRRNKYAYSITTDRPYKARLIDSYWFILDNEF